MGFIGELVFALAFGDPRRNRIEVCRPRVFVVAQPGVVSVRVVLVVVDLRWQWGGLRPGHQVVVVVPIDPHAPPWAAGGTPQHFPVLFCQCAEPRFRRALNLSCIGRPAPRQGYTCGGAGAAFSLATHSAMPRTLPKKCFAARCAFSITPRPCVSAVPACAPACFTSSRLRLGRLLGIKESRRGVVKSAAPSPPFSISPAQGAGMMVSADTAAKINSLATN